MLCQPLATSRHQAATIFVAQSPKCELCALSVRLCHLVGAIALVTIFSALFPPLKHGYRNTLVHRGLNKPTITLPEPYPDKSNEKV